MRIVFVGAGNLATRLALELKKRSFLIEQIYSRTIESAKLLANEISCEAIDNVNNISPDADLYIFSLKDEVLPTFLEHMPSNNGIWVHTAGSVPMNIFKDYVSKYGVVYPFQTFSKNRDVDFEKVPFFFEADSPETMNTLKMIFSKLSNIHMELSSEKRKYLHLTGVFACNFVNHMYKISQDILEKENIPFDVILPLIDETALKVHEILPASAQTGPAVRFDKTIMDKHLSMLKDNRLKDIYQLISSDIHESAKNK